MQDHLGIRPEQQRDGPAHGRPHPDPVICAFFGSLHAMDYKSKLDHWSRAKGFDAAASKGKHGSKPPVITDDMLHTALRRRVAASPSSRSAPA